jgi:hypothetical protein
MRNTGDTLKYWKKIKNGKPEAHAYVMKAGVI